MRKKSQPVQVEANRKVLELAGNKHSELARMLGYTDRRNVWPWTKGLRPFPPRLCLALELLFPGQVTRQELRPHDWQLQWPDLAAALRQDADSEAMAE